MRTIITAIALFTLVAAPLPVAAQSNPESALRRELRAAYAEFGEEGLFRRYEEISVERPITREEIDRIVVERMEKNAIDEALAFAHVNARALAPDDPESSMRHAEVHMRRGDERETIQGWGQALVASLESEPFEATMARYDEIERIARTGGEVELPDALLVGIARRRMAAGAPEGALRAARRAVRDHPGSWEAEYYRGEALRALGDEAAAVVAYRRALEKSPPMKRLEELKSTK